MAFEYNGPLVLRDLFADEYRQTNQDYDRRGLRILVGPPHNAKVLFPPDRERLATALGHGQFSSQAQYNAYMDGHMRKFLSYGPFFTNPRAVQSVNALIQGEQKNRKSRADYERVWDLVFFSPSDAFNCLVERLYNFVGPEEVTLFQNTFRHERVHYALGNSLPVRDVRKSAFVFDGFVTMHERFVRALQKSKDKYRLASSPRYKEFVHKLMSLPGKDGFPRHAMELKRVYREKQAMLFKLGIDEADAAIADAFIGDRGGYARELAKRKMPRKWVDVYDGLERIVEQDGKPAALKFVRNAMDISWTDRKPVIGYLI